MTPRIQPPRVAEWLLTKVVAKSIRYSAIGDFEEQFRFVAREEGAFHARLWYWSQVVRSVPAFVTESVVWSVLMFQNYFKIAFRNLLKHRSYSLINVLGLSLGITCCFLILLYVQDERSYDKFHQDYDRIYRLVELVAPGGKVIEESASAPFPVAPALKNDYPEIAVTRVFRLQRQTPLLKYGEKRFYENKFFFADSTFFDVLTFPLHKGNPQTALARPYSVVLTEETATKYFGNEEPMGKHLIFENSFQFEVTGVLQKLPHNSHIQFDFLASFASEEFILPGYGYGENWLRNWYWNPCYTYLKLPPTFSAERMQAQLGAFVDKHFREDLREMVSLYLQPLQDIHLHSHIDNELQPNSNAQYVYIFSVVAIFILVIACINYMNLATARSMNRAKEIGLRKVVGALRSNVAAQFLGESILVSLCALVISVFMIQVCLPAFNDLSGKQLQFQDTKNVVMGLVLLGLALAAGILSGTYPAFYLSKFSPTQVLKGRFKSSVSGLVLRKYLVVLQFAISIILIASTTIVYDQLEFIQNKKLGFDKEQVVSLPIRGTDLRDRYDAFRNELLRHPTIKAVSVTSDLFGTSGGTLVKPFRAEGLPENEVLHWPGFVVDHDFIETMGMNVIRGRGFSREFVTDAGGAFIVNEAAVKSLGWDDPIGKQLSVQKNKGPVIGVVENFNLFSLHRPIEPAVLYIEPRWYDFVLVRLKPGNMVAAIDFLEDQWYQFSPERPFDYTFLDANFDNLYKSEKNLSQIFSYFSLLAIIIACLGLFGLASFTAEQRVREIGIRKVLGASVSNLILLVCKDFSKWILVANLVAWPVAYWAMDTWLQGFAFRTEISMSTFLSAGVLALVIAWLTVSYQSIQAALANPVKVLMYE